MNHEEQLKAKCPRCNMEIVVGLYIPKEAYQNKPEQAKPLLNVKDVETLLCKDLPEEITSKLDITLTDNNTIRIKPRKFLGKENFWKLANQIKKLDGEYVSQGKNSYFWIPRQQSS